MISYSRTICLLTLCCHLPSYIFSLLTFLILKFELLNNFLFREMTDIDILCSISVSACSPGSQVNQQFTTSSIEQMLSRKDNRKEFIVIENNRKKVFNCMVNFWISSSTN